MNERAAAPRRYELSFTTGALLAREGALLVPDYLDRGDWELVRDHAVEVNLLQARTHSTGVRLVREAVKRLSALTNDEVALLVDATGAERAHLMWAAACRRYELIGEFAEEVLRARFEVLVPTIAYEDFDSFLRTKAVWHEELAATKESTLLKLRSNVFKMLQEAELRSADGSILPAVLSDRVTSALSVRTPSDLRFFPVRQPRQQAVSR